MPESAALRVSVSTVYGVPFTTHTPSGDTGMTVRYASQGLASASASSQTGRAPGFSRRVKNALKLSNRASATSERSILFARMNGRINTFDARVSINQPAARENPGRARKAAMPLPTRVR